VKTKNQKLKNNFVMWEARTEKILSISTIILVILHVAGLLGILSPYRNLFLMLSPINLLLSAFLLFINQKELTKSFYIFCVVSFLAGFFIEVIGINTGLIFGKYTYGASLGFKLINVPLIIGINWLILIYSIGVICNNLKINIIYKSLLGAAMLVILDFFIEPVAVKYDFWLWNNSVVPVQNYIGWFVTSSCLLFLFHKMEFNKSNNLARALYIIQLVFFVILATF
jgi:putative membrane protein